MKQLIKERTTNKTASPVSIPGSGDDDSRWNRLEDELFILLVDQHDRVNLFTKSKYGELERRLDRLTRQLNQFGGQLDHNLASHGPVRQSRRFQRLVEATEEVGEEIQSLSRFSNTQRIAFKKILKKYQKWTGSSTLAKRMNNEVFSHPTSFLKPDFSPLLNQLADLQSSLRHISEHGVTKEKTATSKDSDSTARDTSKCSASAIDKTFRDGGSLEIDIALATTPLGPKGGRAVYWVHPDNVDEVRVLVLRHMRDVGANRRRSLPRTDSGGSIGSRPGSVSSEDPNDMADYTNVVFFDHLEAFIMEQNAATLNHTEDTPGSCALEVMMQANWAKDSKLAFVATSDTVTIQPFDNTLGQRSHNFHIHRVRRKDIDRILPNTNFSVDSEDQSADLPEVRKWVKEHPQVKPLVYVTTRRSRYAGLENGNEAGFWAIMDQSVTMSSVNSTSLVEGDDSKQSKSDFPHTVLDLRWEQDQAPELVNILNASYLTERVRGFSLQTHAVYTICCPPEITRPLWMSILDKDIRKVPPKQAKSSVKRTLEVSGESSKGNSVSAGSTDGRTSTGFSANTMPSSATSVQNSAVEDGLVSPTGTGKKRKFPIPRDVPVKNAEPIKRYWNEFDDGSEAGDGEAYTIFVDPDTSFGFPGATMVSNTGTVVRNAAKASGRKLQLWLNFGSPKQDPARAPLLSEQSRQSSYSPDVEDSSDSEILNPPKIRAPSFARGKFGRRTSSVRERRQKSREIGLLRTYLGCFTAAYILLVVTTILQTTAKRKAAFEADVGVVVGVVASLCLGVMAMGMMSLRNERVSWLHRIAVWLAFFIICAVSGVLLALIADAI